MLGEQRKPPKTLGRFEVGAKIGGGGMATVYLGRDVREDGTEALVALKVIRDELANDEQFTAMFVDEAKILSRLSHPNVIQTLEYGVTGPHRFIAMELLNGRTLADAWDVLKEDTKFDVGLAAWICARVAEGLHSAHELIDEDGSPLSVIHRDVNPTNIFLTHSGEVKLINFGLARARVRVSKSAEGIVKGKIPYLAPEQAHGKPIDRRIDLYALGTTLWEMVTMKRLFKRDNDIDTLKAIRDAHVPDPREETPDFPEALWKIIDRALKRDREERYQSAEEMRADLDAYARANGPYSQKLSTLVSNLFPGGEARQAKWLRDAAAVRIPGTMAPPAPVPIASSSLLEDEGSPGSIRPPSMKLPPPNPPPRKPSTLPPLTTPPAAKTTTPVVVVIEEKKEPAATSSPPASSPPARKSSRPPPPATTTGTSRKSKRPPAASTTDVTVKKKKKSRRPGPLTPTTDAGQSPAEKRRLWMIVGVVVVVLLVLAAIASR